MRNIYRMCWGSQLCIGYIYHKQYHRPTPETNREIQIDLRVKEMRKAINLYTRPSDVAQYTRERVFKCSLSMGWMTAYVILSAYTEPETRTCGLRNLWDVQEQWWKSSADEIIRRFPKAAREEVSRWGEGSDSEKSQVYAVFSDEYSSFDGTVVTMKLEKR